MQKARKGSNSHSVYCLPRAFTYIIWFSLHIVTWVSSSLSGDAMTQRTLISDNPRRLSLVFLTPHTVTVQPTMSHRLKYLFRHLLIVWLQQIMNLSEMNLSSLKIKVIMSLTSEGCWEDRMSWYTWKPWQCAWPTKYPTGKDYILEMFKPQQKLKHLSSQTGFKYL